MSKPEDITGVRIENPRELAGRYGLSARLASHVIELLRGNVDITDAVLKKASNDELLEKTLLDCFMPGEGRELEESLVRDLARRHGYEGSETLRVFQCGGWQTIAFQGDVTASQSVEQGDNSGLLRTGGREEITFHEREELFSPQDIANLKMEALAGQDSKKRVEAVRKLTYVTGAEKERASVFVEVLGDVTAGENLRSEAVRALESMGLDPELAEPLNSIFDEDEQVALSALRRLASVLKETRDAQAGVVLTVLLELFGRTHSTQLSAELAGIIAEKAYVLSGNSKKLGQFIRLGLSHLSKDFRRMHRPLAGALNACYGVAPVIVAEQLWKEFKRTEDSVVTGFLIRRLTEICKDPERVRALTHAAVEEVVSPNLPEDQRSYLRSALIKVGEPAVEAVNNKLRDSAGRTVAELVSLLDVLCRECEIDEETFNASILTMLNILKVGRRNARRRVLEASILADPGVPDELKRKIAPELLSHISEFKMENTRNEVCHSLQKLGAPAISPMLKYLKRHFPGEETDAVFVTLGRIAEEEKWGLEDNVAQESIAFCMSFFDRDDVARGSFCIALAWLCGYSRAGRKYVGTVIDRLQARTWKSKYSFDIIEALGILAGSPNVKTRHQRRIFDMFSRIVVLQTDAAVGTEKQGEDGPVFEFGKGIHFETIIIPAVIKGMERIGLGRHTPPELRLALVKRLLVLWEGVSNVRLVWSPSAVEALVNAIGSVASSGYIDIDMRARLGRALLGSLNKTKVIINLGRICSVPAESKKMRELSIEAAYLILEQWAHAYEEDQDRRAAILVSLGNIAANEGLNPREKRVKIMRETVIETLFEGLRGDIFQVREPLEKLSDCSGIGSRQRAEILSRLQYVYGLIKVEERGSS